MAELADVQATGRLRASESSCEGKHLAFNVEDARRWGKALYGHERFAVLAIVVDDRIAADMFRWDRLDKIGPACFATIEQLSQAHVEEVHDEP